MRPHTSSRSLRARDTLCTLTILGALALGACKDDGSGPDDPGGGVGARLIVFGWVQRASGQRVANATVQIQTYGGGTCGGTPALPTRVVTADADGRYRATLGTSETPTFTACVEVTGSTGGFGGSTGTERLPNIRFRVKEPPDSVFVSVTTGS